MELLDYIFKLKEKMDIVEGEVTTLEFMTMDDIPDIATDMKKDAKEEIKDIGVTLVTDDIILITHVYNALAIHLYRNDSNKIIDENEDTVDMFVALLLESGVPEEDVPEIMENILIEDTFREILELNYKDDHTGLILTPFSKFILDKLDNEFKYIEPIKLVRAGLDKVFKLFDIEELDNLEIVYVLSLFDRDPDDVYLLLSKYEVDLNVIYKSYISEQEKFEIKNTERVKDE